MILELLGQFTSSAEQEVSLLFLGELTPTGHPESLTPLPNFTFYMLENGG
jgi:hypothetical protein